MPQTIDRDGARTRPRPSRRRHGGPVLLVTFDHAPFEAGAARLAVESAADMRSSLYVVDVARTARRAERRVPPQQAAALRAVEALAGEHGVGIETLRAASPRPAAALLDIVDDRRPALIVLATDQTVLRRFRRPRRRWHRRLIRVFAEQTSSLLWIAQEPAPGRASSRAKPSSRAVPAPRRRARRDRATKTADPSTSESATTNAKRS